MNTKEPEISLRLATEADSLCFAVLATQVFLDTYAFTGITETVANEVRESFSTEAFARIIDAPTFITVAVHENALVGFSQTTIGTVQSLAPSGRPAEIDRLYVQEPFTNHGIGSRLLQSHEAIAAPWRSRPLANSVGRQSQSTSVLRQARIRGLLACLLPHGPQKGRESCLCQASFPHCGLTLRSRRGPTSKRQARAVGWRIFHRAGLAICCRSRLSSNVRHLKHPPTMSIEFLGPFGLGALAAFLIVGLFVRQFLPAYFTEKGKNLATKEDMAAITHEVERVKNQYAALLEGLKTRNSLRVAAIDKRLQVHQEAFTHWRELMSKTHTDDVGKEVLICQTWWVVRSHVELSGRQRQDARPGLAKMYRVPPDRAWWPAVGAPLERRVRHALKSTRTQMLRAWQAELRHGTVCFELR